MRAQNDALKDAKLPSRAGGRSGRSQEVIVFINATLEERGTVCYLFKQSC